MSQSVGVAQGWLRHALYPVPNLLEINTLHTTICSVLKWSQSIGGATLMPLAPIRMCQKKKGWMYKTAFRRSRNCSAVKLRLWFRVRVVENKFSAGWDPNWHMYRDAVGSRTCITFTAMKRARKMTCHRKDKFAAMKSFWYLLKEYNIN